MKTLESFQRQLRRGILVAALLLPTSIEAEEPPVLRFDPFGSRPQVEARQRPDTDESAQFTPVLLSTIVRGDRSLVNLGGKILALKEESQGYRLLEVRAFDALFLKDGREILLEVVRPGSDPS